MFLNNEQVIGEIKREIKKKKNPRNKWQWKHNSKPVGHSKISSKREVYINTSLPQEQEKHQIDNLELPIKQLENEQKRIKISRRKEIIKIWAEIKKKLNQY